MSDLHFSIAKMRPIITPLFVLLALVGADAQTTFNNVWHHPSGISHSGGCSVFELADGYLVFASGWSLDSSVGAMHVAKYTLDGEFLWQKEHRRDRNTSFGVIDPIARISDSCFVAGISEHGGELPTSSYIYWFDAEGDTIQTRFLKSDSGIVDLNHGISRLVALGDGGLLHCGWCSVPGYGGCITRLDSAGNFLWEQVYPFTHYIFSARDNLGGGSILGSMKFDFPDQGSIISTDDQGQQIWRRNFGGHAYTAGGSVIQLPDSSYLVPAAWESIDSISWYESQHASLYKYNSSGTQLWRKDYFYGNQATFSHIEPASSDDYWLVGVRHYYPSIFQTYVLKVDADGDSLWMRRYKYYDGMFSYSIPYGIQPTTDGGLIMTGITRQGIDDPQPYLHSNWLIKLDEHGCLVPGCHLIDDVGMFAMDLKQYLRIWPNPAARDVLVNITFEPPDGFSPEGDLRIVLLNALGQVVYDKPWPSRGDAFASLSTQGLPHGVYHLHLTDARTWLAGGKVVVE